MAIDDDIDDFSIFAPEEDEQPATDIHKAKCLVTPHPKSSADLDFAYRPDGPMGAFHTQPNPTCFEEENGERVWLIYDNATKETDILSQEEYEQWFNSR